MQTSSSTKAEDESTYLLEYLDPLFNKWRRSFGMETDTGTVTYEQCVALWKNTWSPRIGRDASRYRIRNTQTDQSIMCVLLT